MELNETDKREASCAECKYIFIFAFTALLSLFVLTYVLRDEETAVAHPKAFDPQNSVDGNEWQKRIDELKNTSDGKPYQVDTLSS